MSAGEYRSRASGWGSSAWEIQCAVRLCLTDDLRRPPYRGHRNPFRGHCYVASEALWHLLGGPSSGYVPHSLQVRGGTHWYLQHALDRCVIFDPTVHQFKAAPNYDRGRGRGFLTAKPSKRAAELIQRVHKVEAARTTQGQWIELLNHTIGL